MKEGDIVLALLAQTGGRGKYRRSAFERCQQMGLEMDSGLDLGKPSAAAAVETTALPEKSLRVRGAHANLRFAFAP
jgi:hypothetical protein